MELSFVEQRTAVQHNLQTQLRRIASAIHEVLLQVSYRTAHAACIPVRVTVSGQGH